MKILNLSRFTKYLLLGVITLCLFFSAIPAAQAAPEPEVSVDLNDLNTDPKPLPEDPRRQADPDDEHADMNVGDVVGEFDVSLGNTTAETVIAEEVSYTGVPSCPEVADYYAYREGRNEVRCTRRGGSESCDYSCRQVRVQGCFSPETLILMGDGLTTKRIDEIEQGDLVWNPARNKAVKVSKVVEGPEKEALIAIGYGSSVAHVTATHPMIVKENDGYGISKVSLRTGERAKSRVIAAEDVREHHLVLGADGQFHPIETLARLPIQPDQVVFNLQLEGDSAAVEDHLLVANGVITGDFFLQEKLTDK